MFSIVLAVLYYTKSMKFLLEDSFVSVPAPVELVITKFADQVSYSLISHLITGILRVFQNLVTYLNKMTISTSFVLPSTGAACVTLALKLNDSESTAIIWIILVEFP